MKRRFVVPILIVLIGSLAVGCSTANTPSSSNKEEVQNTNEQLQVQTKIISDDTEEIQSSIKIPVFVGSTKEEVLKQINDILEKDALDFKEELSNMAKTDFEESKKSTFEFRKYELLVDYEVHTANEELISVSTLNYQYTGGAHGLSVKIPYNFDLATGKEIALSDLFKEGKNYGKILNEEIQKQIKANPDNFYEDEIEHFSGIIEDQTFNIKDGKLFIYFGQYEIAPYSSGIIEFEIPTSVLKDVINSPLIK